MSARTGTIVESGEVIDWQLTAKTASTLTPPGPRIPRAEAASAVAELRASATRAHELVADTARLHARDEGPGALVVDRRAWTDANIASFATLLDPAMAALTTRGGRHTPSPWVRRVGGAATGTELGAMLAFLSTRVLGQYVTAYGLPAEAARLLLVAPNVVAVERKLGLDPSDFRLWVCLHEETHRVQFTAVEWLRDHMHGLQQSLVRDLSQQLGGTVELAGLLARRLPEATRGGHRGGPARHGLPGLLLSDAMLRRLDEVNAVMALLEGHADVVMDAVGPAHIPTVATIRARFDDRRTSGNPLDLLIRRLIGLEAKMAQYRDGAAFVRGVQKRVGVDGFNAVWTSPDTLPRPKELTAPQRWIERVHG